ncbi:MAG: DUF190 domain-containing protein [bacterium]
MRLSGDLPMVIEAVDIHECIDKVLPRIDELLEEGLVTQEKVRVLHYAPTKEREVTFRSVTVS